MATPLAVPMTPNPITPHKKNTGNLDQNFDT